MTRTVNGVSRERERSFAPFSSTFFEERFAGRASWGAPSEPDEEKGRGEAFCRMLSNGGTSSSRVPHEGRHG